MRKKNIQTRISSRYLAHMRDLMKASGIEPEVNRDGSVVAADLVRSALIWLLEEKVGNLEIKEPSEESLQALGEIDAQARPDKISQIRQIAQSSANPEPETVESQIPKTSDPPDIGIRGVTERDHKTLQSMLSHLWVGHLSADDVLNSDIARHKALGVALLIAIGEATDCEISPDYRKQVDEIFSEIWTRDLDNWIIPAIDPNILADEAKLKNSYPSLCS